ncbi:MAG: hypothetical protein SGBAC_007785 [Bacillariaceae sp.]
MQSYQKKSVSFNDTNQYCKTLCRGDYTVRESLASWYTMPEMRNIKDDCRRTVAMLRGATSAGPYVCARGLEGRTLEGYQQKKRNKVFAYMAVADEVLRQTELRISDPQAIADEYMAYTRHCAAGARDLGNLDYLEVVRMEATSPLPHSSTDLSPFKRPSSKPISIPNFKPYGPSCPAA